MTDATVDDGRTAGVRRRPVMAVALERARELVTGPRAGIEPIDPQPSSRGFIALLEAYRGTGGLAPAALLVESLQAHQRGDLGRLARLVAERTVFVVDWRGDAWIPMFQFNAQDLTCKAGAGLVRAELAGAASDWALAVWFAQPNAWLEGRRPVDVMESDLVAVLDAAHWATCLSARTPERARA